MGAAHGSGIVEGFSMISTSDRINDESPIWSSIETGTTLYEGGFVLYADAEWQCLETHQKNFERRPRFLL